MNRRIDIEVLRVACSCGSEHLVQVDLVPGLELREDCLPFPRDDLFVCSFCEMENDLSAMRELIEARTGRPVVPRETRPLQWAW